jgi:hypothetical protein
MIPIPGNQMIPIPGTDPLKGEDLLNGQNKKAKHSGTVYIYTTHNLTTSKHKSVT